MTKVFNEGAKHFIANLDSKGNESRDICTDNPYINGPSTPDKALEWWQGMNSARVVHRKALLETPVPSKPIIVEKPKSDKPERPKKKITTIRSPNLPPSKPLKS